MCQTTILPLWFRENSNNAIRKPQIRVLVIQQPYYKDVKNEICVVEQ